MKRQYYMRNRLVEVEEVEEVEAVRVDPNSRGGGLGMAADTDAEAALRGAGAAAPDDTVAAFGRAGWALVPPTRGSRSLGMAGESPEAVGKVVVKEGGAPAIATQRLNVQLVPALSQEEAEVVLKERGLEVIQRLKFAPNLYETRATAWEDAMAASMDLKEDERFVFAEPSLVEHVPGRATPSDPDFAQQWQWPVVGVEAAWDTTFGAGVRVAVIDNGFDVFHPDLSAGVSPASAWFDDGGSGPVSFNLGTQGMPDEDHGTFCAGMVGARRENSAGGVGAAPDCDLVLIACLTDQVGTQTTLARAVAYAIDPSTEDPGADPAGGPDILVSSLGPNGADWALTSTLELALNNASAGRGGKGLAIFWAASNGRNVDVMRDEVVSHANVIAVVRSNSADLEDNAARGPEVELIAPGVDVFSTESGGSFGTSTGTSFAAPCAAGCAALALSACPDLTGEELRLVMRDTAAKIGGVAYDAQGHNDDYGFGRVDAAAAVALALSRRGTGLIASAGAEPKVA